MLSERDIEAAHPDAFDFVFGNLPSAKRADFNRHLTECRYCQAVVEEYSEIGGIIKQLPPHVNPPAGLEDRVVGAMVAGLADTENRERPVDAEDQGATRAYPVPQLQPPAEPETGLHPRPELQAPPEAEPLARPVVTRLPVWRRSRGRLAAAAAAAAAIIIAALLVIPSLGGGRLNPAQATVVTPLHATTAAKLKGDGAATGQATAHQAGQSWTFTMTVHGLKMLHDNDVYECWWVGRDSTKAHPQFVSGGTFIVDKSGSTTVTMTTGIDPHDFPTMEVTAESPGTGALSGVVILSGQPL
jgi:Anti-sigma-K factor rskA